MAGRILSDEEKEWALSLDSNGNQQEVYKVDSTTSGHYLCLICKMDVPQQYWSSHASQRYQQQSGVAIQGYHAQTVTAMQNYWTAVKSKAITRRINASQMLKLMDECCTSNKDKRRIKLDLYNYELTSWKNEEQVDALLSKIEQDILSTNESDRINCLRLAVWKHCCIFRSPAATTMDVFKFATWMQQGWKELKPQMVHCNAIRIIANRVQEFVDKAEDVGAKEERA